MWRKVRWPRRSLNASDADGDAITLSAVLPGFATLTDNGDVTGSVTASPGFTDAGSYPASATAMSADATADTENFTINVSNTNRPVDLAPIADLTVAEGGSATRTVSASDPDLDGVVLLASLPAFASLTDNGDGTGSVTATPGMGTTGTYPASVTANSADGTSDTENFSIIVTDVDIPVALDPIADINVAEGSSASTAVNATDGDGEMITLTAVLPAFASLDAPTSGMGAVATTVTASPGFSDAGSYPASVTASAGPASDTESFTINVSNTNRPVTLDPIADVNVAEGASDTRTLVANDPDGDAISYSASLPAFASLAGNVITVSPGFGDAGSYPASATATSADATSDTENFTINVSNTNRPVTLDPIADVKVAEGASDTRTSVHRCGRRRHQPTRRASRRSPSLAGNGHHGQPRLRRCGQLSRFGDGHVGGPDERYRAFTINVSNVNQPPTLDQPADMTVNEGDTATQQLTASDPDGDALTYSKVGTTPFFMSVSASGLVTLSPGFADAGSYTGTARVSDGLANNQKSFAITVINMNRCPVADANGPYQGVINIDVTFHGEGSSDPDGDVLTYAWDFGDLSGGSGPTPTHPYAAAGDYTVTLTVTDGACTSTATTTAHIVAEFEALAFTTGGNGTTSLGAGKPYTYVQIEPVLNSFNIANVDLSSIRMIYGTSEIFSDPTKTTVDGDKNGNGATEIRAAFTKANLRILFAGLPAGSTPVTVTIKGNLTTGGAFTDDMQMVVKSNGNFLAASISPNPMNPSAVVSFSTTKSGAVKVQMFDVNGRLVRTLLDERNVAAGYSDVTIDGRTNTGSRIPSGVYFVRITTEFDGNVTKSLRVLK